MDKKILRNEEERQRILDAFYADHDISEGRYMRLTHQNVRQSEELLQIDKRYDMKEHKQAPKKPRRAEGWIFRR